MIDEFRSLPPIFALLAVDYRDRIVPSQYALDIKNAGFDIVTWSFERADLREGAGGRQARPSLGVDAAYTTPISGYPPHCDAPMLPLWPRTSIQFS
jgi:hypothetical protein